MYKPIKQRLLLSGSVTSAQSHTAVIDTLGADRVTIGVDFATVTSTNPEITLKLGEGDTTSAFTDIAAATGGTQVSTSVGFVIPNAPTATTQPQTMQFDVDMRNRKRYLLLTVTPFTTKVVSSFISLMQLDQGPNAVPTNDFLLTRVGF